MRVHTNAKAAESTRALNAKAYTVGQHIAFGRGQYVPQTVDGRHLLAHELTHVVQQGSSVPHTGMRIPLMMITDSGLMVITSERSDAGGFMIPEVIGMGQG